MTVREIPPLEETAVLVGTDDIAGNAPSVPPPAASPNINSANSIASFLSLTPKLKPVETPRKPEEKPVKPGTCGGCGANLSPVEQKMGRCLSCGAMAAGSAAPAGSAAFRVGL